MRAACAEAGEEAVVAWLRERDVEVLRGLMAAAAPSLEAAATESASALALAAVAVAGRAQATAAQAEELGAVAGVGALRRG